MMIYSLQVSWRLEDDLINLDTNLISFRKSRIFRNILRCIFLWGDRAELFSFIDNELIRCESFAW